jgi:hypothetical protein
LNPSEFNATYVFALRVGVIDLALVYVGLIQHLFVEGTSHTCKVAGVPDCEISFGYSCSHVFLEFLAPVGGVVELMLETQLDHLSFTVAAVVSTLLLLEWLSLALGTEMIAGQLELTLA